MAEPEVKRWRIRERDVKCPHCGSELFWARPTLMNTTGATFFGFDWANREATALVCADCTRIEWFMADGAAPP